MCDPTARRERQKLLRMRDEFPPMSSDALERSHRRRGARRRIHSQARRRENRMDLLRDDEVGPHGAGVRLDAGQLDGLNRNRILYVSFGRARKIDVDRRPSVPGELHYDGDANSVFANFLCAAT